MKVVEKRQKPWYVGLQDRCQGCGALVEFEVGDVYSNIYGDYRGRSLYCWECVECGTKNYDTQSGLQERR